MSNRIASKVLLIGWDAADWQIINPLLDSGKMPTLAKFVSEGVIGNLATLKPMLSPMLWNSIATGKLPDKHGILGFIEPKPGGEGVQPTSSTSRKCKALWNILSQSGLRSNVISWYASHPAEPIDGVIVSEHFARVEKDPAGKIPTMPAGAVHPPRLASVLDEFRVIPDEIGPYHLAPFVPTLGKIPPEQTSPVTGLRRLLARCGSTHAAATHLLEHEPWDFAAVYYEAIDHTCHGFMEYHPPRMPHVNPELFERYKDVVTGMYRFHDMMLERLLDLAGEDTTVIICSDHGFLSDHLRPAESPDSPGAGPEAWHRHHGILAIRGPGIARDERIYGASILDIAPTILTLFGLPVGQDMDGKVLVQCFAQQPVQFDRVETWEKVDGAAGMHPADLQQDPFEQQEALNQLVELGYIDAPDGDTQKMIRIASTEAQFNLATSHFDSGQPGKAIPALEKLHADTPADSRFGVLLAQCYLATGRLKDARSLIEKYGAPENAPQRPGGANPSVQFDLLMAQIEYAEGNVAKSLERLLRAEQGEPRSPQVQCQIGTAYARLRRWADAQRAFGKASESDSDNALAQFGLGMASFYQHRLEDAVERLLRAVGLVHYFPRAHFMLGVALAKLGWYDRAVKAFEVALTLRPGMPIIHRYPRGALWQAWRRRAVPDAPQASADARRRQKQVISGGDESLQTPSCHRPGPTRRVRAVPLLRTCIPTGFRHRGHCRLCR